MDPQRRDARTGMPAGLRPRESAVARLWREEGARLPPLDCDDGRRLRVLYPGRPSADAGPDFRDALLLTETGELLRGDVEVHLRPGGWRAHGHHRDRRYNGVVLHVVLWPSSGGGETTLAMGARVPTVALYPVLQQTVGRRRGRRPTAPSLAPAAFWAAAVPPGEQRVGATLERAGDARFNAKAASFRARLRQGAATPAWRASSCTRGSWRRWATAATASPSWPWPKASPWFDWSVWLGGLRTAARC